MKKIIAVLILLILFYGEFTYVDLSKYTSKTKTVEVKGEVNAPGVYEVAYHASIKDILDMAKGVNENGDLSDINLTSDAANHSVIVVRSKQEEKRVSINAGTLEELDSLNGIGPAIAKRIMEYRKQHPFQSLEELKEVKGIGEKLFDKIKDRICL